ncbi:MAG: ribonuclease HII [Balneolaceae bacterium]|nr:ribonuclease HII [Balneolaceae bacterium]MDR9407874.1 ribonuclease HII [Balneolaceae bacterium]
MDRYQFETKLWEQGFQRVMGLDEVGRGCLCGPVVAAGVILKPGSRISKDVADSKSIDEKTRIRLREEIKEKALFWTVQKCSPGEIDEINILKASIRAMMRCSEEVSAEPDYLLVDGNRFTSSVIPHSCIVKGDDKSVSIAAASILAKVHRDQLMRKLHKEYPHFGWETNVGYPTKEHFEGLKNHGYTKHHRKSFKLRTEKVYKESNS